ncbi:MAG: hypothetical protein DYH15_12105 [Nitrosomonas sp. PRO4]|nr:hypothetical protein [Nitrosomonas sp. PRO4]
MDDTKERLTIMQTITEENDMGKNELKNEVMKFAQSLNEPFTAGMAFDAIKDTDDRKAVSDAMRGLYLEGKLARKKIDNTRFAYTPLDRAPDDYERVFVTEKQPSPELHETEQPVNVTPIHKPQKKPKQPAKTQAPEPVGADSIRPNRPDYVIQPQTGEIKIPENFVLSLQTPGGLVITIKTGIV